MQGLSSLAIEIKYRPMEAQSPNQSTTREFLGVGSLILGSRSEWEGESWREGNPHKMRVEVAAMGDRCLFHRTSEEGRTFPRMPAGGTGGGSQHSSIGFLPIG